MTSYRELDRFVRAFAEGKVNFLVVVGSPFLGLKQGIPDATVMPAGVPSRDAWVSLQADFRAGETTPIIVLLDTKGDPLSASSIAGVQAVAARIAKVDGVDRVAGPDLDVLLGELARVRVHELRLADGRTGLFGGEFLGLRS